VRSPPLKSQFAMSVNLQTRCKHSNTRHTRNQAETNRTHLPHSMTTRAMQPTKTGMLLLSVLARVDFAHRVAL
jgi:hypothetical protein